MYEPCKGKIRNAGKVETKSLIFAYLDFETLMWCAGVRGISSAAGSHWHFHAWQDSHAEDFAHSNFPCSLVAEGARECCHGSLSGELCVNTCTRCANLYYIVCYFCAWLSSDETLNFFVDHYSGSFMKSELSNDY